MYIVYKIMNQNGGTTEFDQVVGKLSCNFVLLLEEEALSINDELIAS